MNSTPRHPASSNPTAAAGHTRNHEDLAGLYALDVLDGDELSLFEQHLARCPRCRDVVAGDRLAVGALASLAPERDPSPDFKARLMARAERELAAMPTPDPVAAAAPARATTGEVRRLQPRRDWGAWMLPVAALFFALIAGTAAIGQQLAASQVVASWPLQGTSSTGIATVVVRRSGDAALQLQGLPAPPPGGVYQAWLIAANEPPAPAGAAPRGSATIPLEGDARGKIVAITVEPRPGARAPSSAPILSTQVPA